MSSMWTITVQNRGARWVDLKVVFAHPDAGGFPESKGFALQLLLGGRPISPLHNTITQVDHWDAEALAPLGPTYIESARYTRIQRVPWSERRAHERMDRLNEEQGLEREEDAWNEAWMDNWRAFWADETNLPTAVLRITATDPEWVSHLKVGTTFDTASWCPDGPWLEEPRHEPGQPDDAEVPEHLVDFPLATAPKKVRDMNPELIWRMASGGDPADLQALLQGHREFLARGGAGGSWALLSLSGMPMCIYRGPKTEGQLSLRGERLEPGTRLHGEDLRSADLSGCIAEEVDFGEAILDGCVAIDSYFRQADFTDASLVEVDFSGADLRGAIFRGANLRGADFEYCDCTGADFTGAILAGSRFPSATLDDVKR